jgi:hypothetical protein
MLSQCLSLPDMNHLLPYCYLSDFAGAMALYLETNPDIDAVPAGENLLAMAVANEVKLKGLRSPNLLLYTGAIGNTREAESVEQGNTKITMNLVYGNSAGETRVVLYKQRAGLWTKQESWEAQTAATESLGAVRDLVVTRDLFDGYYAFYFYDAGGDGLDGGGSFSLLTGEANESSVSASNVFATGVEFESWVSVEFRVLDGVVTETITKNSNGSV